MGRRSFVGWLAIVLLLGGCADSGGPASCRVDRVADLPLLPNARPMVEAKLDGTPVALLVDTGAATSALSLAAVDRFGLGSTDRTLLIDGVGGFERAPVVSVHELDLGGGHARDLELPALRNLPVTVAGLPFLGIFGADFLSNYDVDVDVPGRRFRLYTLHGCGAHIAPLDPPFYEVPFRLDDLDIGIDIRLDDAELHAILDTGASRTLVTRNDAVRAARAGLDLGGDPFHARTGDAHNQLDTWRHRFGRLEIGAETLNNFHFDVGDTDGGKTLLGNDFLRFNHVWISYPLHTLFIRPDFRNPMVRETADPSHGGPAP